MVATLGAAVGMLVGFAALALALWTFPKFRRSLFGDPQAFQGVIFAFGAALLLGGWVGYSIFAKLFQQ